MDCCWRDLKSFQKEIFSKYYKKLSEGFGRFSGIANDTSSMSPIKKEKIPTSIMPTTVAKTYLKNSFIACSYNVEG